MHEQEGCPYYHGKTLNDEQRRLCDKELEEKDLRYFVEETLKKQYAILNRLSDLQDAVDLINFTLKLNWDEEEAESKGPLAGDPREINFLNGKDDVKVRPPCYFLAKHCLCVGCKRRPSNVFAEK